LKSVFSKQAQAMVDYQWKEQMSKMRQRVEDLFDFEG
jgi:hypothetical protein